jgi:hypothetical protein
VALTWARIEEFLLNAKRQIRSRSRIKIRKRIRSKIKSKIMRERCRFSYS